MRHIESGTSAHCSPRTRKCWGRVTNTKLSSRRKTGRQVRSERAAAPLPAGHQGGQEVTPPEPPLFFLPWPWARSGDEKKSRGGVCAPAAPQVRDRSLPQASAWWDTPQAPSSSTFAEPRPQGSGAVRDRRFPLLAWDSCSPGETAADGGPALRRPAQLCPWGPRRVKAASPREAFQRRQE